LITPFDRQRVAGELREFVSACCEAPHVDVVLADRDAAREIVRVAAERPAGLIVMGTQGHGGFERLLLGSVTEKVLRKASCPVLTVPRQRTATPSGRMNPTCCCPT
jgi:nucleotide-binding universal stress UspA family protein